MYTYMPTNLYIYVHIFGGIQNYKWEMKEKLFRTHTILYNAYDNDIIVCTKYHNILRYLKTFTL